MHIGHTVPYRTTLGYHVFTNPDDDLHKEVYMYCPLGFEKEDDFVYKLKKSLYGFEAIS